MKEKAVSLLGEEWSWAVGDWEAAWLARPYIGGGRIDGWMDGSLGCCAATTSDD